MVNPAPYRRLGLPDPPTLISVKKPEVWRTPNTKLNPPWVLVIPLALKEFTDGPVP